MEDSTITLNQNAAECIKLSNHFGEAVYHNICTGATHSVAWGSADWAIVLMLVGMCFVILVVMLKMLFGMITGRF